MENKNIIIIGLVILIPLMVILFLLLFYSSPQNSPVLNLEECRNLQYNGADKINLVFFSDKLTTKQYSDFIFTISPFNNYKESFNIYYIENYTPKCELYQNIAVLCYSKELIKKASSCPNDYVIVLKEESPNIRSSAYMNVMSLNTNHVLTVFAHEFGHVFANFAEEYTPADIPKGSKNCQAKCISFNNKSDGCFEGCSKENYFRSVDNGIMRTLNSNEYGSFNEKVIIEKLLIKNSKITGKAINSEVDCNSQKYYLIEGRYFEDKINVIEKSIEVGCIGSSGTGPFTYKLILSNTSQATGEFNPELIFTDIQNKEQNELSGQTYSSDQIFLLKIPIIPNGEKIEIIKDNEKISEIKLNDIGFRPCKI